MRRLGVHTSIAGGIHLSLQRAHDLGCTTLQIFSHNPRGWSKKSLDPDEAELFRAHSVSLDLYPPFIHSSYLINLASPDRNIREKSIDLLAYELNLAHELNVPYLVLHPGKTVGQSREDAVRLASEALSEAYSMAGEKNVAILLENTAGQKGDISATIPDISEIIELSTAGSIGGICLDSCHAYAAGYDIASEEGIEKLSSEIERYIAPLEIRLIHLNDSKKGLSSGIDRHEEIGKGEIGLKGLEQFLSYPLIRDVPIVLETPKKSDDDDRKNLAEVRKILGRIEGV